MLGGGYTQNQLDAAYDQDFWDNAPPEPRMRDQVNSNAVRARFGEPERIQYGPSQYEFLDLYRTLAKGKTPIMIYIHGGSWRRGSARNGAVPAEMFMEAGGCSAPSAGCSSSTRPSSSPMAPTQVGPAHDPFSYVEPTVLLWWMKLEPRWPARASHRPRPRYSWGDAARVFRAPKRPVR